MAELLEGPGGAPLDVLDPGAPPARYRVVVALLAAATVAAGGAWLVHATSTASPDPTTTPAAPAAPATRAQPPLPPPEPPGTNTLTVRFTDSVHGYALVGRCGPSSTDRCAYLLRATVDGGQSWQTRRTPLLTVAANAVFSADLFAFGPQSLLVTDRGDRWFSADAGRSWRDAPPPAAAALASLPDGWALVGSCPYGFETTAGCGRPIRVLDPATGREHPLANQPRLLTAFGTEAVTAHDGSLWVTGGEPGTGRPVVAVTRDRGRSWRSVQLTPPATPLLGVTVVTHDGRTAYAFVRAQAPTGVPVKNGLGAVWRTTDGGARWQRVPPLFSGAQPRSLLGVALLPDGRLLATTEDVDRINVRYSTDGGHLFLRAQDPVPSLGWIDEVAGRYVAGGMYGGHFASRDGVHWTPILN